MVLEIVCQSQVAPLFSIHPGLYPFYPPASKQTQELTHTSCRDNNLSNAGALSKLIPNTSRFGTNYLTAILMSVSIMFFPTISTLNPPLHMNKRGGPLSPLRGPAACRVLTIFCREPSLLEFHPIPSRA